MNEPTQITIDVISDVACPWCFIGMKRLERASQLVGDVQVKTRWRPYQLDPSIPPEGLPRREYMLNKFGDAEKLREAHDSIVALGEVEGIRFNFAAMELAVNTFDAHRLIRWGASPKAPEGAQDFIARRLFELNFEEAQNVSDKTVLVGVAEEAGLDPALVEGLLSSDADVDNVRTEMNMISQMGVRGVPCFLLEGKYAIMGAQDADTLADAIQQVAEAKARGELDAEG